MKRPHHDLEKNDDRQTKQNRTLFFYDCQYKSHLAHQKRMKEIKTLETLYPLSTLIIVF